MTCLPPHGTPAPLPLPIVAVAVIAASAERAGAEPPVLVMRAIRAGFDPERFGGSPGAVRHFSARDLVESLDRP